MDKGIRNFVCRKFLELAPKRLAGEYGPIDTPLALGNRVFRKTVCAEVIENFHDQNLRTSATHYNHAFKEARKTNPELCAGLGRPEDKKGGRKRKVVAEQPVQAAEGEQQQEQTAETQEQTAEEQPAAEQAQEPAAEAEQEQQPAAEAEPQQQFTVIRVKDGAVIAAGLTEAAAAALVQRAAQQKKAKLAIQ